MLTLVSQLLEAQAERFADEDGVIPVILIVGIAILVLALIGLFSFCGDGVDE